MNGTISWLQFRVGDQLHALDAAPVRQILRSPTLLALPLAQRHQHCAARAAILHPARLRG